MDDAKELVTVYSVKYCLTVGIQKITGEVTEYGSIMWREVGFYNFLNKGQWFWTLDEAREKANDMRRKKIASLTKQIQKLEALTFAEVVETAS